MSYSHDKSYKHLLSYRKIFRELMEDFVHQPWKELLDLERAEQIPKSYVLPDFEGKEGDVVYRVPLKERAEDVYLYILVEHQSTVDFSMPFRLLVYITELWRDIYKNADENQRKSKSFRLPPVFPIVLYNGDPTWTASRNIREMVEENELFRGYFPDFTYYLLDVSHYSVETLQSLAGNLAQVFLLEHDLPKEEIFQTVLDCFHKLAKETDEEVWKAIAQWAVYFLRHTFSENQIEGMLAEVNYDQREEAVPMIETLGEKLKAYWKEEGLKEGLEKGMEEGMEKGMEKGLEEGMEKGLEEGMEKGLEEGMEKGLEEGQRKEIKKAIYRIVEKRFGKVPLLFRQELEKIDDMEVLEGILDQTLDSSEISEIKLPR